MPVHWATEAETRMAETAHLANADDDKLIVQFYDRPVIDQAKSDAEGRPIFHEACYVRIITPGDKDNIVDRPMWEKHDEMRFPKAWERYQKKLGDKFEGTPLDQWPPMTRTQVLEFKYFNIFTVEQLANVPDSIGQKFMGIGMLKKKAADFLALAKDTAHANLLRTELEKRDAEYVVLKKQNEELSKRLDELAARVPADEVEQERPRKVVGKRR